MQNSKLTCLVLGKVLFALSSLLSPLCAVAQEAYLSRLAATMQAADPYEVSFVMEGEGVSIAGRYQVAGSRYRITLPEAEVWGEGALRYEVDHRRQTITVMPVDTAARNLLDNPTRAFDFVATDYTARLVSQNGAEAVLELTTPSDPLSVVRLTLALPEVRPTVVRYEIDGIGVDVRLRSLRPLQQPLPAFQRASYEGYELVDFR